MQYLQISCLVLGFGTGEVARRWLVVVKDIFLSEVRGCLLSLAMADRMQATLELLKPDMEDGFDFDRRW
jgi:hypothetical protein